MPRRMRLIFENDRACRVDETKRKYGLKYSLVCSYVEWRDESTIDVLNLNRRSFRLNFSCYCIFILRLWSNSRIFTSHIIMHESMILHFLEDERINDINYYSDIYNVFVVILIFKVIYSSKLFLEFIKIYKFWLLN